MLYYRTWEVAKWILEVAILDVEMMTLSQFLGRPSNTAAGAPVKYKRYENFSIQLPVVQNNTFTLKYRSYVPKGNTGRPLVYILLKDARHVCVMRDACVQFHGDVIESPFWLCRKNVAIFAAWWYSKYFSITI